MARGSQHANRGGNCPPPTRKGTLEKHVITTDAAPTVWHWLRSRGGLAIWCSVNPQNLGGSWTTPLRNVDGTVVTRPNSDANRIPGRVISDPAEVVVSIDAEVNRFRIFPTADGSLSKTDVKRIRSAVASIGEGAYYRFDNSDVVVYAQAKIIPIAEWIGMADQERQEVQREAVEAAKKNHQRSGVKPGSRKSQHCG